MPWNRIPDVEVCCGCVTDLRTAAVVIALLGIITSPAVSWAVVRHTYSIRVSCLVSTNQARSDVVDVNVNNVLSFGFGSNAGLGPTCLSPNLKDASSAVTPKQASPSNPSLVKAVQYMGWIVLTSDVIFVMSSVMFLLTVLNRPEQRSTKVFIITALVTMLLSFVYSMLYVSACLALGGSFPVFEFLFALVDLTKWTVWIHFLLVIKTFYNFYSPIEPAPNQRRHEPIRPKFRKKRTVGVAP